MKVIADICIVPIGVGVSLSSYIAACGDILNREGLHCHLHAYGTNVEGEWELVMDSLRECHEKVHAMGAPRISTTIKLGTRSDRKQTMREKVESVQGRLRGTST